MSSASFAAIGGLGLPFLVSWGVDRLFEYEGGCACLATGALCGEGGACVSPSKRQTMHCVVHPSPLFDAVPCHCPPGHGRNVESYVQSDRSFLVDMFRRIHLFSWTVHTRWCRWSRPKSSVETVQIGRRINPARIHGRIHVSCTSDSDRTTTHRRRTHVARRRRGLEDVDVTWRWRCTCRRWRGR